MQVSELAEIQVELPHQGKCTLPLFVRKTTKNGTEHFHHAVSAVVYGANGSGKSSIARALLSDDAAREFISKSRPPSRTQSLQGTIDVFNDDFIQENFRNIEIDELHPIVLLGDAAKNRSVIEALQSELEEQEKDLVRLIDAKREAEKRNETSTKVLKNALRGDDSRLADSWGGRSTLYNTGGQRRNITKKVIDSVREYQASELVPIQDLRTSFDELISRIQAARDHQPISWNTPQFSPPFDLNQIARDMKNMESISVIETDQDPLARRVATSTDTAEELDARLHGLLGATSTYCPHCFQNISEAYKEELSQIISRYLDELRRDDRSQALLAQQFTWRPSWRLPELQLGDGRTQARILDLQEQLSEACTILNTRIHLKATAPTSQVTLEDLGIEEIVQELQELFSDLEDTIRQHNNLSENLQQLQADAEDLSCQIAAIELAIQIDQLLADEESHKSACEAVTEAEAKKIRTSSEINRLLAEERGEEAAAERINELLRIVSGDSGLRISAEGKGYKVTSRAHHVAPGRLSTGERNILALCYFFVRLAEGHSFENSFKGSRLIVLDDPVSSFDFDNKYGVVSLINYISWITLTKDSRAKLLILTHDPSIAQDFSKSLKSLQRTHLDWILRDGSLEPSNFEHVDSYLDTLRMMYAFGVNDSPAAHTPSKNDVRRVCEAFARFELGENVSDAVSSGKVRDHFKRFGERHSSFLSSFPARIFIHPDSHSDSNIKHFDFNLLPSMTDQDFKRFVRDVLIFMYLISPYHLPGRIANNVDEVNTVRSRLDGCVEDRLGSSIV